VSELGTRGRLEAGFANGGAALTGTLEGRLADHSVLFQDGFGRRVGANLFWDATEVVRVHASIFAPLERVGGDGPNGFAGIDVRY